MDDTGNMVNSLHRLAQNRTKTMYEKTKDNMA